MKAQPKTRLVLACLAAAICCAAALGQVASLNPPAGAGAAIVVFQDLQWPDCASAYPVLRDAARARNVPLVIHDFPLPRHNWSFQASVNARYFSQQSQQLGDEFRGYILQNQSRIADEAVLRQYTEKFASAHQMALPAAVDPDGKLAEAVHQDFLLGQRLGVEHTPTVFVAGNGGVSAALVGPVNRERLSRLIDEAQRNAMSTAPAKSASRPRRKAR